MIPRAKQPHIPNKPMNYTVYDGQVYVWWKNIEDAGRHTCKNFWTKHIWLRKESSSELPTPVSYQERDIYGQYDHTMVATLCLTYAVGISTQQRNN